MASTIRAKRSQPKASARRGVRSRSHGKRPDALPTDEARLDFALVQTFPASDPIAVGRPTATEAPARPIDRKAPEFC